MSAYIPPFATEVAYVVAAILFCSMFLATASGLRRLWLLVSFPVRAVWYVVRTPIAILWYIVQAVEHGAHLTFGRFDRYLTRATVAEKRADELALKCWEKEYDRALRS